MRSVEEYEARECTLVTTKDTPYLVNKVWKPSGQSASVVFMNMMHGIGYTHYVNVTLNMVVLAAEFSDLCCKRRTVQFKRLSSSRTYMQRLK
jgi:hypothetical protein